MGTSYHTKQLQAHYLYVDFYFALKFGLVEYSGVILLFSYLHKGNFALWKLFLLEYRGRGSQDTVS